MKEDVPSNHINICLPILDTEMIIINNQITHYHYSKPMSLLEVTNRRSAMSKSAKIFILVQEGNRRAMNTSKNLPWEETLKHVNKLMVQMFWAQYSCHDREIVARRILAKLENDTLSNQLEGRPFYRSKQERKQITKSDKASWFRDMGATATLMVPTTSGSMLARRLREVVIHHPGPKGTSLKVVEIPGKPLMSGIRRPPSDNRECHNTKCPLESSGQICNDQCRIENILYKAI